MSFKINFVSIKKIFIGPDNIFILVWRFYENTNYVPTFGDEDKVRNWIREMAIKDDIVRYKRHYGVQFDDNLYVAILLGVITKRHILVSSSDVKASEIELRIIIRKLWKVSLKVLHVEEKNGLELQDILDFFVNAASHQSMNSIYLIVGLDKLSNQLQTLILEVIRSRKITLEGNIYHAGELFTVVGLLDDYNSKDKQLFRYLQDSFWFKQPHDAQITHDAYHLEAEDDTIDLEKIRSFKALGDTINNVIIVPEMKRYIYDIIIFVRTHRCVNTGLPGSAIPEMQLLSKALCVLFNKGFVIPSIVKLAARKLLPLKIRMIRPEHEPSLQWGSDPELVNELMKRMTPQLVVEDILRKVSPPV